jgi:hypothetical protein
MIKILKALRQRLSVKGAFFIQYVQNACLDKKYIKKLEKKVNI